VAAVKHASDDRRAQPPQAASTGGLNPKRILVGEFGRVHGVRGLLRLHAYTEDPDALADYAPLTDATGTRTFKLEVLPNGLARVEGIADRDAAAKLTGTKLYVARDRLPPPEDPDEFLLCDLEGLKAVTADGRELGTVKSVEDYGGGSFLTVLGPEGEQLLPFTKAVVPVVDIAGGRITVVPPGEVVVREEDAA
jgi:16S rRNA processing protein RimM